MITLKLWDTKEECDLIKAEYLNLENIRPNPNHTRKFTDERGIEELADSIKEYGVLQPIAVRYIRNNFYELISGQRRLKAAKLAGLKDIPAVILKAGDKDSALMSLVENLQRQNLNFFEEAKAYESLIKDYGLSIEEIGKKAGKSRSAVSNKLRLLKLPDNIKRIITNHGLTERHGRALLRIPDEKIQFKALIKIVENDLTVKKTEELVDEILKSLSQKPISKPEDNKKITRVVNDMKLYKNTILESIEFIRRWGVDAQYEISENKDLCEIKIMIPLCW